MIKTFNKMDIEERYLNIIKAIYDEPSTNIMLILCRYYYIVSKSFY